MIEFGSESILGIKNIDKEHRILVDMLNHTYKLLKTLDTKDKDKIAEINEFFIGNLIAYVELHLKNEEEFMKSIEYPELSSHKLVHGIFRSEIYNLLPYVERGDPKGYRQALSLSWVWLYNHIARRDKKYALWAKKQ